MNMATIKGSTVGGIIALSLAGITLTTPIAEAATPAELQAQIQSLLAQISSLQAQIKSGTGSPNCPAFGRDLTLGMNGQEVTELQNFLIGKGHAIAAGATGYFGEQTRQALVRFQASENITPAVGHFGPITRAKAKGLCAPVVTPPPTQKPPTNNDPVVENETLSGEAFIDRFEVKDGNDTDVEENETDKEVMEISFRVTDGDVRINRFDFGFTPDINNNEKDPWDTFKTVSVWQGTKKIAEIDASKEKSWKEDSPTDGDYLLRLSGLNWVIKENKTVDVVVKITTQKSIKGASDGEIWNIFVPTNGIRGLDADKAVVYAGDTVDAVTLNIDRAGATDEIIIRRSDDDMDASTLQLKDNNHSGFLPILAFDIDTDDSKSDIEIRRLPVQITVSTSTLNTFMRDIRLVVDGKTYTSESTINGGTATVTFELKSKELVIDAGDRVTALVEIDFRSLDSIYEGTTITGSVAANAITAKGNDTLAGGSLAGSVSGETHTMKTRGADLSSNNAVSAVVTSVSGNNNDYATFRIDVNLRAFGQDVYIPIGGSSVNYQMTDSVGNALSASGTAIVTSSADERNGYFIITDGNSETVTLEVTYVPGVPNTTARLQLTSIGYSDSAQNPNQSWIAQPANKYRTPTKIIVN